MNQNQNSASSSETLSPMLPPVAEQLPHIQTIHGDQRRDDYHWLREKTDQKVIDYLAAENAYAEHILAPTKELQDKLYVEMLGRIKQTDLSVPYRKGNYYYYSRTEAGKQYSIYCRKAESLEAEEQVLINLNSLAEGENYLDLGVFKISDDGNLLAYSLDRTGFRQYTLYVKDLRTGEILSEGIEKVGSVEWAKDNRTIFYTVENEAKRQYRLYRHTIGSPDSELIFEEADELFRLHVERTRDRNYIFAGSDSYTTSEYRYIRSDDPAAEWQVLLPRQHDIQYDPEYHDNTFYLRINDTGRNFRLVGMPTDDLRREKWTEIIPHRPDVLLQGVAFFQRFRVIHERKNGLPQLHITELRTGDEHLIEFPEPAFELYPSHNHEWDTNLYRYGYESLVTPSSVFDYNMDTREGILLKQIEVLGGYDISRYTSERLYATAADGTRIPISLVYRNDFKRDGSAPLLLTGYGSYGFHYPVTFSSPRLSLLDRGFVFAIAHIRGGSELGKPWHDAGKMNQKMNTFTDFIAISEHLITQQYTSSDGLIIEGGSAGGLLMGAVVNMRPELFKAIISHVPFVDVINTMLDASLPLTVGEYEEWGNPNVKEEYEYIRSYCPYTNLKPGDYPAMLVKTSLHDSQVMYWEPAKYVARLRTLKNNDTPLLLITNMEAGHGGASGRYDKLRELSVDYAFMLWQMGISE
jgi:oligopeptidase B